MKKTTKAAKTTWMVMVLGWTGEPSETIENGIRTYTPGTAFGWQDLKAFDSPEAADDWLRELRAKGYSIEDCTVVRR